MLKPPIPTKPFMDEFEPTNSEKLIASVRRAMFVEREHEWPDPPDDVDESSGITTIDMQGGTMTLCDDIDAALIEWVDR